ncbi:hypothetical protein J6590_106267, partial [Homalodisca vitripennis]
QLLGNQVSSFTMENIGEKLPPGSGSVICKTPDKCGAHDNLTVMATWSAHRLANDPTSCGSTLNYNLF